MIVDAFVEVVARPQPVRRRKVPAGAAGGLEIGRDILLCNRHGSLQSAPAPLQVSYGGMIHQVEPCLIPSFPMLSLLKI